MSGLIVNGLKHALMRNGPSTNSLFKITGGHPNFAHH